MRTWKHYRAAGVYKDARVHKGVGTYKGAGSSRECWGPKRVLEAQENAKRLRRLLGTKGDSGISARSWRLLKNHWTRCLSFYFLGLSGGLGRDWHSLYCCPGIIWELRSEDKSRSSGRMLSPVLLITLQCN